MPDEAKGKKTKDIGRGYTQINAEVKSERQKTRFTAKTLRTLRIGSYVILGEILNTASPLR
jgi:hypothetical protein